MMQSRKPASGMSTSPLVPRGPLGRLRSHLAKRGRTGAKTLRERISRSDRSGSWYLRRRVRACIHRTCPLMQFLDLIPVDLWRWILGVGAFQTVAMEVQSCLGESSELLITRLCKML